MRHWWLLLWGYRIVDVAWYEDVSFGKPGVHRTELLYRSADGRTKTRSIDGIWPRAHFLPEDRR